MRKQTYSRLPLLFTAIVVIVMAFNFGHDLRLGSFSYAQEPNQVKKQIFKEVKEALQRAQEEGVPLLSPNNFAKANEFYQKALEDYDKGERLEKIRENQGHAMEHIDRAFETAKLSRVVLERMLRLREETLNLEFLKYRAGITRPHYFKGQLLTEKDFLDKQSYHIPEAEQKFRDAAMKIEDGDVKSAKSIARDAEKEYRRTVIEALKKDVLADATKKLEDTKDTIPKETFRKAKAELDEMTNFIEAQKSAEFAIGELITEVDARIQQALILVDIEKAATELPELPFINKFPMYCEATIFYPAQLGGGSQTISGSGYFDLLFEATDLPNKATVLLKDCELTVPSFGAQLDVNGDGIPEVIETGEIVLRLEDFDAEASTGTIDLETGDIAMTFALSMRPEAIPLFQRFGIEPAPIHITERGKMDMRTGDFETHAGIFPLTFLMPDGSPVVFQVKGGQTKCNKNAVYVNLSVNVNDPYNFGIRTGVKKVWICEGEGVRLIWDTGVNVQRATLFPGNINIKPTNLGKYPAPPGQRIIKGIKTSTVFLMEVIGCTGTDEETTYSDWVVVNVVRPGWDFHREAKRLKEWSWELNLLPDEYSPSIRVKHIKLQVHQGSCTWHANWDLTKSDPTGKPTIKFRKPFDLKTRKTDWTDIPQRFPLAFHYEFVPASGVLPNNPKQDLCLIFLVSDKCIKTKIE